MEFVDQAVAYLRDGFANINQPKGLLIALVVTIFMGSWRQWVPLSLVAVLIHIIVDLMIPVLSDGADFALPPLMEEGFWTQAGVLFLGYLIVIGVFFLIKSLLFRSGAAKPAH
ncbi:MAG: hypothetical protein AB7P07_11790 [Hyphomonadaceae bacterium]